MKYYLFGFLLLFVVESCFSANNLVQNKVKHNFAIPLVIISNKFYALFKCENNQLSLFFEDKILQTQNEKIDRFIDKSGNTYNIFGLYKKIPEITDDPCVLKLSIKNIFKTNGKVAEISHLNISEEAQIAFKIISDFRAGIITNEINKKTIVHKPAPSNKPTKPSATPSNRNWTRYCLKTLTAATLAVCIYKVLTDYKLIKPFNWPWRSNQSPLPHIVKN